MDLDSDIHGFGVAKFDNDQLANIFGFSHMGDKHRITYDNAVEDAFIVHTPNGKVKFKRDGRLYTFQPSEDYLNEILTLKGLVREDNDSTDEECYMISTVKGNYKGFTDKQVRNAKRAWRLYINTGGGCLLYTSPSPRDRG